MYVGVNTRLGFSMYKLDLCEWKVFTTPSYVPKCYYSYCTHSSALFLLDGVTCMIVFTCIYIKNDSCMYVLMYNIYANTYVRTLLHKIQLSSYIRTYVSFTSMY